MTRLLEQSSEHYRLVLREQIDILEELLNQQPESRDERWRAKHDIALALARDSIKRVLPPDSALFGLFMKAASESKESTNYSMYAEISLREFELLRNALRSINWASTDNTAGSMPSTPSLFLEVERILPQLVYRHRTFKNLMYLLMAIISVMSFGVFRFYNITIDIGHEIREQQTKLETDFARQRTELESFLTKNRLEATSISDQLNLLGVKIAEAKNQLGLLETDAQATVARFAAQVNRSIDSESAKAIDIMLQTLNQRQKLNLARIDDYLDKEARPQLKSATEKRIDQILTDPGKPFVDTLKSFEERVMESQKLMNTIETRQRAVEGRQQLTDKAYSILPLTSPSVVDRLASYIGEALWIIYGGAFLMFLFVMTNIWVLWRSRHTG